MLAWAAGSACASANSALWPTVPRITRSPSIRDGAMAAGFVVPLAKRTPSVFGSEPRSRPPHIAGETSGSGWRRSKRFRSNGSPTYHGRDLLERGSRRRYGTGLRRTQRLIRPGFWLRISFLAPFSRFSIDFPTHPVCPGCHGFPEAGPLRRRIALDLPRSGCYNDRMELGDSNLSSVTNKKFSTDGL